MGIAISLDQNTVAVKPIMDADTSKNELHFPPLCSPLPRAWHLESHTKLSVFNQEQLQRFEKI